jgi:short-subunit dehydrogenase
MASVMDWFSLQGRRALITGGSRGLRRAMAQALAEAGADLVLVGRDEQNLRQAASELSALGRQVVTLSADLNDPEEAE